MNKEIWKPVVGYEGLYEVSSIGRIRSLNYYNTGKSAIMPLQAKEGAYIKVSLKSRDGEWKCYRVHRLVAMAFLPKPSPEQRYVNHINGNKQDNRVENLEWCTAKQNSNNPNTKENYHIRYHKEGEWERRSQGQKRRFAEHPEQLSKLWASAKAAREKKNQVSVLCNIRQ